MSKLLKSTDGNYLELEIVILRETQLNNDNAGAILFDEGDKEIWLPKSQLEDIDRGLNNIASILIPEWLAIEKELV